MKEEKKRRENELSISRSEYKSKVPRGKSFEMSK